MSCDGDARMEYKHYWRNVVMRYHVVLEGWPDDIPFRNLSETSSPLDSLEKLLQRLQHKKTYWKKLTDNSKSWIVNTVLRWRTARLTLLHHAAVALTMARSGLEHRKALILKRNGTSQRGQ
jgi:hypothetical protein